MEITSFIVLATFYSGFFGWYRRTLLLIEAKEKIDRYRYMIPRVLMVNMIFSYVFALLFYAISNNKLILIYPFITTLISIEFLWFKFTEVRQQVQSTLSIKFILIILAAVIAFYVTTFSSTYIEQLTGVSTGVFSPFIALISFILGITAWILLAQCILTSISLFYTYKIMKDEGPYLDNVFGFFVCGVAVVYVLMFIQQSITKELLPFTIDTYFVETMYHPNVNLDEKIICTNLNLDTNIALLPSGKASVVGLNAKGKQVFTLEDCQRK
jgi:hypothetical protein